MDLVDRLERLVRRHILAALPDDGRPELAAASLSDLLIAYRSWRNRFVRPVPREVHRSPELANHVNAALHCQAIDAIEQKLTAGQDVTPHLSRAVHRLGRDPLLADWGIHHLHLSTTLDPDGFAERTGDVLLVACTQTAAYLLDVRTHERDGDNWAAESIFAILVRNWPRSGLVQPLKSVTGLAQHYTDAERRTLRQAGVANLLEIDGRVYVPGRFGQTTAGTPIEATRATNAFMWELRDWRESDPYERLEQVDKAPVGGYWTPAVHVVEAGFEEWAGFRAGAVFVPTGPAGRIV